MINGPNIISIAAAPVNTVTNSDEFSTKTEIINGSGMLEVRYNPAVLLKHVREVYRAL